MLFGCTCKPEEYEIASQTGFDYIEFPCRIICGMEEVIFSALNKQVDRIGTPVIGMNLYCPPELIISGPGYDAEKVLLYAKTAAARGSALGVNIVGIGSPRSRILPDGFDQKTAKSQLTEFLLITAAQFDRVNITVAMEALGPCFCNFINTVPEAYEIVNAANKNNLKIVADFYNMEHSGEADNDLTAYMDKLVHMHISDDDGSPTLRSFLKPEKYPIHKPRIRRLIETGYNGGLTIETDIPFDDARAGESLQFLKSV